MNNIIIEKNKYWDQSHPRVTVITPVFNRPQLLLRAMKSVQDQTFENFEYIIINDGSTDNLDPIINKFMDSVAFPVLYIKKPNGGVHTARNLGISFARGEMVCCCDSDDELFPTAIETCILNWDKINCLDKKNYREVCARVVDQNGLEQGDRFPDNINSLPWKKAKRVARKAGGEHFGFWRRDTLLECKWPEPEGVTFVTERVVWDRLSIKYRSLFVNNIVRRYHKENDNSYTRDKKWNSQTVKNRFWNEWYRLNTWKEYGGLGLREYLKTIFKYMIYKILATKVKLDVKQFKLVHFKDRLFALFFLMPAVIISLHYYRRHC